MVSLLDLVFPLIFGPEDPSFSASELLLLSLLVSLSLESGSFGSPSQTSISTERHPRRRTYMPDVSLLHQTYMSLDRDASNADIGMVIGDFLPTDVYALAAASL